MYYTELPTRYSKYGRKGRVNWSFAIIGPMIVNRWHTLNDSEIVPVPIGKKSYGSLHLNIARLRLSWSVSPSIDFSMRII
jgi:hypothetical protein